MNEEAEALNGPSISWKWRGLKWKVGLEPRCVSLFFDKCCFKLILDLEKCCKNSSDFPHMPCLAFPEVNILLYWSPSIKSRKSVLATCSELNWWPYFFTCFPHVLGPCTVFIVLSPPSPQSVTEPPFPLVFHDPDALEKYWSLSETTLPQFGVCVLFSQGWPKVLHFSKAYAEVLNLCRAPCLSVCGVFYCPEVDLDGSVKVRPFTPVCTFYLSCEKKPLWAPQPTTLPGHCHQRPLVPLYFKSELNVVKILETLPAFSEKTGLCWAQGTDSKIPLLSITVISGVWLKTHISWPWIYPHSPLSLLRLAAVSCKGASYSLH